MDNGIYRGDRVKVITNRRGRRVPAYTAYVSAVLSNGYEIECRTRSVRFVRPDQIVKVADGDGSLPSEKAPVPKAGHLAQLGDQWYNPDDEWEEPAAYGDI